MALSPNSLDLVPRHCLQSCKESQTPHRAAAGSQNSVPPVTGSSEALGRGSASFQTCLRPGLLAGASWASPVIYHSWLQELVLGHTLTIENLSPSKKPPVSQGPWHKRLFGCWVLHTFS